MDAPVSVGVAPCHDTPRLVLSAVGWQQETMQAQHPCRMTQDPANALVDAALANAPDLASPVALRRRDSSRHATPPDSPGTASSYATPLTSPRPTSPSAEPRPSLPRAAMAAGGTRRRTAAYFGAASGALGGCASGMVMGATQVVDSREAMRALPLHAQNIVRDAAQVDALHVARATRWAGGLVRDAAAAALGSWTLWGTRWQNKAADLVAAGIGWAGGEPYARESHLMWRIPLEAMRGTREHPLDDPMAFQRAAALAPWMYTGSYVIVLAGVMAGAGAGLFFYGPHVVARLPIDSIPSAIGRGIARMAVNVAQGAVDDGLDVEAAAHAVPHEQSPLLDA